MRGKVEIFSVMSDGSEEKVFSKDNMIVDGAGETIVDMLTTPSSMITIYPALMDASNWRINAMSFGPPKGNFGTNPDRPTTSCCDDVVLADGTVCGVPANYATELFLLQPWTWANVDRSVTDNRIVRSLWVSASVPFPTASSYSPPERLPTEPHPSDIRLEDQDSAYAIFSGDGTASYGHFENRINYSKSDASAYIVGAYSVGFNPSGADNFWVALVSSITDTYTTDRTLNITASDDGCGSIDNYNGKDSGNVDYRGFIRALPYAEALTEYTGWDPDVKDSEWEGRVWFSGVGVQDSAQDFVVDPRIRIDTTIHERDIQMFNMYGGLHQLGLWTFDMKKTMEDATPPFSWSLGANGTNNREYRLFAKRTVTENIARIKDVGATPGLLSYAPMRISWTLDFRSSR